MINNNAITLLFAYRNRDTIRVDLALKSLALQTNLNFDVVFVDYGSKENSFRSAQAVIAKYDFATYYYIGHQGLLWNKSKALNYGIEKSQSEFVLTADVDLLFAPQFIETVHLFKNKCTYSLFKIGYLSKRVTEQQQMKLDVNVIATKFIGDTFGVGLYAKSALQNVGGLDEFFHFYGSEDEDLNFRIQASGIQLHRVDDLMLYHQWHERYPIRKDSKLTVLPRLSNILRLNQRHFLRHKMYNQVSVNTERKKTFFLKYDLKVLEHPGTTFEINNIAAHVSHFFEEELPRLKEGVYKVVITEDPYYTSWKYKCKLLLGKHTQPYLSMKTINDTVLKCILFKYRHNNYSYEVSKDLKQIYFSIVLKSVLV